MTTYRTLMQKCYVIIDILRSTSLGIERKIATDEVVLWIVLQDTRNILIIVLQAVRHLQIF